LRLDHGVVVGATGQAFTARAVYTLQARNLQGGPRNDFGPLPDEATGELPAIAPAADMTTVHVNGSLLSLVQLYQEFFQHFAFDSLPRIDLAWDLLHAHREAYILHHPGVSRSFLLELGFAPDRLLAMQANTVYSADVVWLPVFVHRSSMGAAPAGSFTRVLPRILLGGGFVDPANRTRVVFLQRPPHGPRSVEPSNQHALLTAVRNALKPPYHLDTCIKGKRLGSFYYYF
jgi:hypothetical protein